MSTCKRTSPSFMVEGMFNSVSAQENLSGVDTEQLRPKYGVEEDQDPGQASKSMMSLEDLGSGEASKEWGDSFRVEESESGADLEREKAQPDTGGHVSRKKQPKTTDKE